MPSLTAGAVVVCCEIDAVFWPPARWTEQRSKAQKEQISMCSQFWNIWEFSEVKCKYTSGKCRNHRLRFPRALRERGANCPHPSPSLPPSQAALQALSGFVYCQKLRWRFSHCKHSAGSRPAGWIRMELLTHDSLWQQQRPRLPPTGGHFRLGPEVTAVVTQS